MRKTISALLLLVAIAGCYHSKYGHKQRVAFVDDPLHSYLSDHERSAVLEGRIYRGMARDVLLGAWGQPSRINTSSGSFGSREQFVYRTSRTGRCYVYVDDGVVTGWQY